MIIDTTQTRAERGGFEIRKDKIQIFEIGSRPTKYESIILETTFRDDRVENSTFYDTSFQDLSKQLGFLMSLTSQKFIRILLVCDDLSASALQMMSLDDIKGMAIKRGSITKQKREELEQRANIRQKICEEHGIV